MRRRRFLGLGLGAGAGVLSGCGRDEQTEWVWRGVVFQSPASMTLRGVEAGEAEELARTCVEEMKRLEGMFSLQDPESTISQLNREGVVREVPEDFRTLLKLALALGERSKGVFDPTIQPYWNFLHEGGEGEREEVLKLVDFRNVMLTKGRVAFARDGMALTLNGVVQGYVTDRVSDLLRAGGVESALINVGEYYALGSYSKKKAWTLGVRSGGAEGEVIEELPLENAGLAVSSGAGYRFGNLNHLVHPEGHVAPVDRVVAVEAPLTVLADGLSTACSLMGTGAARDLVADLEGVALKVWEKGTAGKWWEV